MQNRISKTGANNVTQMHRQEIMGSRSRRDEGMLKDKNSGRNDGSRSETRSREASNTPNAPTLEIPKEKLRVPPRQGDRAARFDKVFRCRPRQVRLMHNIAPRSRDQPSSTFMIQSFFACSGPGGQLVRVQG